MPKLSKFKVVLVGDQNVGKTSIISRFIHDSFEQSSNPTVGIDFVTKTLQIDGETIRLQLWDTAGQERFRSLIPSYVRDADCCLIVLDVSSKQTYDGVDKWLDFVRETRGQDGLIYLIANKIDLEREVDKKDIEVFAENNGVNFMEVSAKNSQNISMLFRKVAENLVEKSRSNNPDEAKKDENTSQVENEKESENRTKLKSKNEKSAETNCSC